MMSEPNSAPATAPGSKARARIQWAGLVAGPVLFGLLYALLPGTPGDGAPGLSAGGRATAGLAAWMAAWWLTEAVDLAVTALLPLAVLPLGGAGTARAVAAPYGHELIFLFMGGFILALAMERWGLHRRVALLTLRAVGPRPDRIVAGFMGVSAFLSMWVSNTAAVVTLLPIALSVIDLQADLTAGDQDASAARRPSAPPAERANLPRCLLLGMAYAASIGGVGTVIGTPPNLFLVSYLRSNLGIEVSFARWMGIGVPLVLAFLPLSWWLLAKRLYPVGRTPLPGGRAVFQRAYRELGPVSRGEGVTLCVFLVTALCWITRPLLVRIAIGGHRPLAGLTDAGIAILASLVLFVAPIDPKRRVFAMDWAHARKLPWGILVLFGGGLSLAKAIQRGGVGGYLGQQASALHGLPLLVAVGVIAASVTFLTELTSNTATTATLVPILAGLAPGLAISPIALTVPAALAASCAFMLPVATPPNAIVFGAGKVTVAEMSRAGLWLNLIGIVLVTAVTYLAALPLLGVGW